MTGNANASSHRGDHAVMTAVVAQTAIDTVKAMREGVGLFRLDGAIPSVTPAVATRSKG